MDSHFPHNLVSESILWEMSALFDYKLDLLQCSPHSSPCGFLLYHLRLKDKQDESQTFHTFCAGL